jgi:hypothetical protein
MQRQGVVFVKGHEVHIILVPFHLKFKQVKSALALLSQTSSHALQPTTWALTSCSAALSKNDVYSVVAALGTKSYASVTPHLCTQRNKTQSAGFIGASTTVSTLSNILHIAFADAISCVAPHAGLLNQQSI